MVISMASFFLSTNGADGHLQNRANVLNDDDNQRQQQQAHQIDTQNRWL